MSLDLKYALSEDVGEQELKFSPFMTTDDDY